MTGKAWMDLVQELLDVGVDLVDIKSEPLG